MSRNKDDFDNVSTGRVYVISSVKLSPKDLKEIYQSSSSPKIKSKKVNKKSTVKKTNANIFNFSSLADVT